jgi:hypothetical protein
LGTKLAELAAGQEKGPVEKAVKENEKTIKLKNMENAPTIDPVDPEKITNADESKELPGPDSVQVQPPEETDELDKSYEGRRRGGNVAAEEESETNFLDGSNANNLRTK